MNKSIKYLGFSFLGGLLLFTLGALRPFIASENGLAFGLTASNAVMVGSFRSMSGAVTNICADFSTPQHVRIMPQTANTGEFDIGDSAQATGRYLMFSKLSGTFLLGHDGTDAFRVNVANGYVTMPGGALFGDGTGGIFEVNANAQFEIDPLGQLFLNGDDTVASHRSEIFLHGTNAHIRLDLGAPIEDWTAVTHLTMAPGSASLDGALKISGSGGSKISQTASNGLGIVNIRPDFTMANTQTVVWPTNLPAVGQHLGVKATNWYGTTNLEIQTDWETAGGGSQTPWLSDINGGGFWLTNVFKLGLGIVPPNTGSQTPSIWLGGTNSAGTQVMYRMKNTNSTFYLDYGTGTTFGATSPMTVSGASGGTITTVVLVAGTAGGSSVANSITAANNLAMGASGQLQWGAKGYIDAPLDGTHRFLNNANALAGTEAQTVFISGTNTVSAPAPLYGGAMGAQLWSDGTNLCVVLQNSSGTRTTNKVTMSAWP